MIKRIENDDELMALPNKGIEANKIRSMYLAYGLKYDFCRFYRQDNCFLCSLDGSFVICGDVTDINELSQFLCMNGFSDVFCSESVGVELSKLLNAECSFVNMMKYSGNDYYVSVNTEPKLSEVYDILKDGFDIDFEPWYLDMSHRVRHGISKCYTLDNSATVTVQYCLNNEALISQVATKKDARGQGKASDIVKAVSSLLNPNKIYVLCEDKLVPFYQKTGYSVVDKKCIIYNATN